MEDSVFLAKILQCPQLSRAVEDLAYRSGAINLVTPDWKTVLETSDVYKRHINHAVRFSKGREVRDKNVNLKTIIGTNNCFNVIVAGYWYLSRPSDTLDGANMSSSSSNLSFVSRLCTPLVSIGESMREGPSYKLQDNCRFFVEACNPIMCIECLTYQHVLGNNPDNNWCIRTTRVFNGDTIKNTTKAMIEQTFAYQGGFMGIMNLSINSRMTFGADNHFKIGGVVKEMLLFKESSIHKRVKIDLDLPASLLSPGGVPSISYPVEEEEDETIREAVPRDVLG